MKTFADWWYSTNLGIHSTSESIARSAWQACTAEHEAAARELGPCGVHPKKLYWIEPCDGTAPQDKELCALLMGHSGEHDWVGSYRNHRKAFCIACDREKAAVAAALERAADEVKQYRMSEGPSGIGKDVNDFVDELANDIRALITPDHAAALQRHTEAAVEARLKEKSQ